MHTRSLAGVILASALVTLDGTATTIALAAIGQDLSIPVSRLQWISNAPLVVLAALLVPGGAIADRFGRVRVIRAGLLVFGASTAVAIVAPSYLVLVAARFLAGAGSALILPASLAMLRGGYSDASERTRVLGVWAAWTGVAAAAGPLLSGGLVDLVSWRAVFVPAVAAAAIAFLLLMRERNAGAAAETRREPVPVLATAALMVVFGTTAYLLTTFAGGDLEVRQAALPGALALPALFVLARAPSRHPLVPREVLRSQNCVPANAATFALYFGMFGVSFLLALYTQQALGYGALRSAFVLLPISIMLFLAEPFGRLATRVGTRRLVTVGTLVASAGLFWIGSAQLPVAFWSRMIVGTALFGLGLSIAVSPLTHAAVAALPEACGGAASGLNHAVVRAAGLLAIALLGSIAAPGASDAVSPDGFKRAMLICATVVAVGGVLGSLRLKDEEPGGLTADEDPAADRQAP
jgi:MFS family permease